jgi:ABC-type uncharacterized transport system involved in gliding motility auxiliary subunit
MPRTSIVTTFILALAGLLAINLIASQLFSNINLDMTEEKLYTLSDGSKKMLGKLDDRLKVKFYYSKKSFNAIPLIAQYAELITGLLGQYESYSDGMVSYEVLEPEPDSEIEEWAIKDGIQALPAQVAGGDSLYLGLAISSEIGASDSIGFLDPQREDRLEYDISRLISAMSNPEKKTIGVMSAIDVLGSAPANPMMMMNQRQPPPQAWVFLSELKKQFHVRKVELTATDIDNDIDLLVVIHPKGITEGTEYAIDQFILRGGRGLIMVDPLCVAEMMAPNFMDPQARMQATYDSTLDKLFKGWGFEMSKDKVLADFSLATQMSMQSGPVRHPAVLTIGTAQCNQNEIISSDLEQLNVIQAGIIEVRDDAPYEISRLFGSTEKSGELSGFMLKLGVGDDQLKKDFKPRNEAFPIGVRVAGTFKTAFPDGKPGGSDPLPDGDEEGPAPDGGHLAAADEPGAVVVFADVDLAYDDFIVRKQQPFNIYLQINDNLNLLNNAVEQLLGSSDLIGLRTRGKSQRPFTRVEELEFQAQEKFKGAEEELVAKLEEAQRKLGELQRGRDKDERALLNPAQVQELKNFRKQQAETKKRLREVRHDLRKDIEALGAKLKFINIALMPLLVLAAGFLPGYLRAARLKNK